MASVSSPPCSRGSASGAILTSANDPKPVLMPYAGSSPAARRSTTATAKAVFFDTPERGLVFAVIRGDLEVNEAKLRGGRAIAPRP